MLVAAHWRFCCVMSAVRLVLFASQLVGHRLPTYTQPRNAWSQFSPFYLLPSIPANICAWLHVAFKQRYDH